MDAKAENGVTALMSACRSGHLEAARLLLQTGADRSLPTPFGPPLLEVLHRFDLPEEAKAQLRALLA